MVMMAGNLAFSPEFEKAKTDLQSARENYTALVEEYTHLIGVVGKNLESEYMLKIGKKEYELFSCQVEILRFKREISLYQAARNRGETITPEAVEKIIAEEFEKYLKELEKQKEKLDFAENYFKATPLTPEESKKVKDIYRNIVRNLHPDLNPGLPDEAAILWERVQLAYQMNDWEELFLLNDMVMELLSGKKDFIESVNSLERLQNELAKVADKTSELENQLRKTRERLPFAYEKLLRDPAALLVKRHDLDEQIKLCYERIEDLKNIKAQLIYG